MSSRKHHKNSPYVYSTDPDFPFEESREGEAILPPSEQQLKITLDTKHRKGKTVTLVEGFSGTDEDRESLGKKLKTACGTGGSVKDDLIIVQGAHVEKVKALLSEWEYKVKK
ncbi:MAG: translation initiation factor [Chitinophagaceae bacterium]